MEVKRGHEALKGVEQNEVYLRHRDRIIRPLPTEISMVATAPRHSINSKNKSDEGVPP